MIGRMAGRPETLAELQEEGGSALISEKPAMIPGRTGLREAPIRLAAPLFGHCPNSDYTPPHSNGHSGALFFRADLSKFAKSPF